VERATVAKTLENREQRRTAKEVKHLIPCEPEVTGQAEASSPLVAYYEGMRCIRLHIGKMFRQFSFYESGVICATTWIRPTGGWSNCCRRMRSLASNHLASKISISVPTVRTRLRNLLDRNLAKIVGLLNLTERPELVSAIVGINVQGRGHTHEIARRIADVPFVNSASVVTGCFDIIVDIVVAGDVADLYHVALIPGVGEPGDIVRRETFVVMTSCNKWVSLPKGCWSDDTEAVAPRRKELP
jgi:DNA-binding Lrp family transcriptional regulator